jgi:tRNA(Ile)-lysidine synthase
LILVEQFERALEAILARVCVFRRSSEPLMAIGIAYSGGLDSSVLLHLMRDYVAGTNTQLFAFHVHHGISANADAWLAHCSQEAVRLGAHFDVRRVNLRNHGKTGVEEAARLSRYEALGELCRMHHVPLLLTAHHQDDQAETVLLQLLRGSGVAGLSGMDAINAAPDLLGDSELLIGRPLLAVPREDLEQFATAVQVAYVEDESNADTRYARNALRHHVMPELAKYFPGFQERFARSAQHARSAQGLLDELAARDLELCAGNEHLDISRLHELPDERIDNLLRRWFHLHGLRMPSTAWLGELRTQLLHAEHDAQVCVTHPDCHVRRYRDRLMLTPKSTTDRFTAEPQAFRWNGERSLSFVAFGGSLHFDATLPGDTVEGIDAQWLLGRQDLSLRCRQGGERLKLAPDRPARTLKQHYQSLGIPAWERGRLPLVFAGGDLLFAAGVGADCRHFTADATSKIRLRWSVDAG